MVFVQKELKSELKLTYPKAHIANMELSSLYESTKFGNNSYQTLLTHKGGRTPYQQYELSDRSI